MKMPITPPKMPTPRRMIASIDRVIPGFAEAVTLTLPGTPVTYEFYTARHMGMVGGFPQSSIFSARSPRTGLPNLRLVGDSIFPGQSTAGVTLGAMRVAEDVLHHLPRARTASSFALPSEKVRGL